MDVVKVINNNLVKSIDENKKEVLVMGCGIGYKKHRGDKIENHLIEKIYILDEKTSYDDLITLLLRIPVEYIQVANEIIDYAIHSLGKELNENIYFTLTDHLSFAMERIQKGIVVKNALLWEIEHFYNHEYLIGKESLHIIKRKLGVELSHDEAGFIALHIVNAEMDSVGLEQTNEMTKMIYNILNIVKYYYHLDLNEYSIHYERFITHLKFFVQRIFKGKCIESDDTHLLTVIKECYPNEYECALKVKEYILKDKNYELTDDEIIYLAIHLNRVIKK